MRSKRASGLLEEALAHSVIGTFCDCENYFTRHRNGGSPLGSETHFQFTTTSWPCCRVRRYLGGDFSGAGDGRS
jgi:hypothetical protein